MNCRIEKAALAVLILLPFAFNLTWAKSSKKVGQRPASKTIAVLPYYHPRGGCQPAEVKVVVMGSREALTSQVTVVNFSEKPVKAMKLGWNVYELNAGNKRVLSECAATLEPAEVFLTGSTPLIQLGPLSKNETCNISLNPLMVEAPATKTVFVEQPIITWDQIKPLTVDGVLGHFKENYVVVLYVSEIQFDDGATWQGTIK